MGCRTPSRLASAEHADITTKYATGERTGLSRSAEMTR